MSPPPFYAHTLEGRPPQDWEPLETHLQDVSKLAGEFAEAFGAGEWGRLAGLWHDLGKYLPDFQRRIRGEQIQVEHAGAGAWLSTQLVDDAGAMAFVIAGHHAGLTNRTKKDESKGASRPLDERLVPAKPACDQCVEAVKSHPPSAAVIPLEPQVLALPEWIKPLPKENADCIAHSLWVRMLFSALVDADSIATEAFCSPEAKAQREALLASYETVADLRLNLDSKLDAFGDGKDSEVNAQRRRVLEWCREASQKERGFFTLCVPTGGGKTLASMSFALRHAVKHAKKGMRRVIVCVPFTSIIEQNSGVYAAFLGAGNVIEHHSNIDDYYEREERDEKAVRRRLACENWDAPVIVTTNVQFFESLFTNKRSRARKLHNIAGSVIILDEAQCVPGQFLEAILLALRELVSHYGCSVVICTATQPAWCHRAGFAFGIPDDRLVPIIPPKAKLLEEEAFDRVTLEWPEPGVITTNEMLAERMAQEPCALAIVHLKKDATNLAAMLMARCPGEALFHLSTNMCPAHRREMLAEIRAALEEHRQTGKPCRVVSTNLVEAGVDIDVPVVFRALAGFDSLAQAAGRCNREGKLAAVGRKGRVIIYTSESEPPSGLPRKAMEVTKNLIKELEPGPDLRRSDDFDAYFTDLYTLGTQDKEAILREAEARNFETIARKFKLIEEGDQVPVIVPYNEEAKKRLAYFRARLEHVDISVAAMRALQPYTVNVWRRDFEEFRLAFDPLEEGSEAYVLNLCVYRNAYSLRYGIVFTEEAFRPPPGELVC